MDRLTEMDAFAAVVDQGGFTRAACKLGISKSAVSKHVASLEARLSVRLLNRTTRRVSPTEIGLAFYDRARSVLKEASAAESLVTDLQTVPSGPLRISVATDFGVRHLSPILHRFVDANPQVKLSIILENRFAEPISDGFDLMIRVGAMDASSLRARKFTETAMRIVAAPSYLRDRGRPARIDDLSQHRLLRYALEGSGSVWRIRAPSGEMRSVHTSGCVSMNDGQSLLNAAVSGLGIAYLPSYLCADALREGLLEQAIANLPLDPVPIHAVHPSGRFTPPKVRAFIEFLVSSFAGVRAEDW